MSSTAQLLKEAESVAKTDSKRAESLYKQILSSSFKPSPSEDGQQQAQTLRDQETALVNLGQLYRDQKCVTTFSVCFWMLIVHLVGMQKD